MRLGEYFSCICQKKVLTLQRESKYYTMKRQIFCLLVACVVLSVSMVQADKPALRYVDAREFRIINHGWSGEGNVKGEGGNVKCERENVKGEGTEEPHTLTAYTRIPTYLKDSIRQELWDRGLNSAGIGIRFATNSKRIGIRYNLHSNFHMAHMADTGIKGTDLYIWCPDVNGQLKMDNGKLGKSEGDRSKEQRTRIKEQRAVWRTLGVCEYEQADEGLDTEQDLRREYGRGDA